MQKIIKITISTLILVLLLTAPFILGSAPYYLYTLTLALLFVALAYSWGLLYYAGSLSLGHAGFFGLGAYTSALLVLRGGCSPWSGLIAAGLIAALSSLFLALLALRLKGAYFTLATLAFAEILKALTQNFTSLTNGPWGLLGIPPLTSLSFLQATNIDLTPYYLILAFGLFIFLLIYLLYRSGFGLGLACLRENPLGAAAIGINPWLFQTLALFISAGLAGVAGAFYAHTVHYLDPTSAYNLHFSAAPLIMCLLGGALTLWGPLVGALGLYLFNELLLAPLFPHFHEAFYGLAVVMVFLFMPQGVIGKYKKYRGMSSE